MPLVFSCVFGHDAGMASNHENDRFISDAKDRRVALQQEMRDVEMAAQAAAGTPKWRAGLFTALHDLSAALARHIETVDAPDGLIEQAVSHAPHTDLKAQVLRDDHPVLVSMLEKAIDVLQSAGPDLDQSVVADVRSQVEDVLVALHRHRQAGSDFVWEAYGVDIGGVE